MAGHPNPYSGGYQHPPEQADLNQFGAPQGAYYANPGGPAYGNSPYGGMPPGAPGGPAKATSAFNLIWFAAACLVMLGALISLIDEFFSLEWVDALEMIYMFIFGGLMATLDMPVLGAQQPFKDIRTGICKYIAILQRVTGKGVAYIFLGCALTSSMWANLKNNFLLFLTVLIGLFVVCVGLFSLVVAVIKSRNLNLVRQELRLDGAASLSDAYAKHAKQNPQIGLNQEEFKTLTPYARGVQFESADIKLIFNALSTNPRREYISIDDLQSWVLGDMMVFI